MRPPVISTSTLRKLRRSVGMQARLRAIDLGLFAGQDDYRRFLIVGQGRSGSNLLRGLLNSHPHVLAFGELFRLDGEVDWGMPLWHTSSAARARFRTAPLEFLRTDVFRVYPSTTRAVGVKLFYNHARTPDRAGIWTHLLHDPQVHVLHLTRRNLLASLVSLRHAERSGSWVSTAPSPVAAPSAPPPLVLTPDECVAYFEATQRWQQEVGQMLPRDRTCDLTYEDLVAHQEATCARVQTFLGLPAQDLRSSTVKQLPFTPRETVANFDDLARTFASTPWRAFFEA